MVVDRLADCGGILCAGAAGGARAVRLLEQNSDFNPLLIFIPLRHEACGGAVFILSPMTVSAIEAEGLRFFEQARQGRGYPKGHHSKWYYYAYEPWQETPVPAAWTSEGMWIGLACLELGELGLRIRDAAREAGSYYTTKPEGELLVVPSLGIVVFTYYG